MTIDSSTFEGFRNLDGANSTIATCLESLTYFDHGSQKDPGYVALAVTGAAYAEEAIVAIAEKLPQGQVLWAFSPTPRNVKHERIKVTHVPAKNTREFQLKICSHLARFVEGLPEGTKMRPSVDPFPVVHLDYVEGEKYIPVLDIRHSVQVVADGVPYEFFVDLRSDCDKLVVFHQDSFNRDAVELPRFDGWKIANRIDASVVSFNDPTVYLGDKLGVGWWIGTRDNDYLKQGADYVKQIIEALGIENRNVLFVGVNEAGFAALSMASLLPGSHSLVDSPRVSLCSEDANTMVATEVLRETLGFDNPDAVPAFLRARIDVISRWVEIDHFPEFIYLQNRADEEKINSQLNPFLKRLQQLGVFNPLDQRVITYSQRHIDKGGRFPLKDAALSRAINLALDTPGGFPESLTKEQISAD